MENATCDPLDDTLQCSSLFSPSSYKITEYRINQSFGSELKTVPENDQSLQGLAELRLSVGPGVFEWAAANRQMEPDQDRGGGGDGIREKEAYFALVVQQSELLECIFPLGCYFLIMWQGALNKTVHQDFYAK